MRPVKSSAQQTSERELSSLATVGTLPASLVPGYSLSLIQMLVSKI